MNKKLQLFLLTFLCFSAASAQFVRYSDTFVVGQSYCPGSSQYDGWVTFRAALDTTANQFLKLTVKGTFDQTGRTCSDQWVVRKIAAALKNGVSSTYTCNSYTWKTGTPGGCYSNLCGSSTNEVELTVDGTTCSCTNSGYSFRPAITNTSWGGINTYTCSGASQRMTAEFQKASKNDDAGVSGLTKMDICTNFQSLSATVSNFGKLRLDSFRLYWSVNGVLQTPRYITSKLASSKDTVIVMNSAFGFTNSTLHKFKVWTSKPNGATDSVPSNDTLNAVNDFLGNPATPSTTDFKQCGGGRPLLTCIPGSTGDTILWYDKSVGGTLLGTGKSLLGPLIKSTTTFYVQSVHFGGTNKLSNGFNGTSYYGIAYSGGMVDVKAFAGASLDSITFRTIYNQLTSAEIWYRVGTYVGYTTTSSGWTLVNSGNGRNFSIGGINYCKISAKGLSLNAGQVYGFYVTTSPSAGTNYSIAKPSAASASNSEMSITGGTLIAGQFGANGTATNYTIDLEISTKKSCSNPVRAALKVTVNPRPVGATALKGSVFKGQFRQGTVAQPDITAPSQTVSYEFLPPTGYSNSNHGSTWVINSIVGKTTAGFSVPSADFATTSPSGSGNGTLTFNPSASLCDSVVTFTIKFTDLGPYFCDSFVTRTIKVAPTPKTNFSFPAPVCDGTDVIFNNLTTIGCAGNNSGFGDYKWYFGDGDSSDLQNPVHLYSTYGCYPVRLVTISSPWNIVKDTTILVCVTEVPSVKFKSINACEGTPVKFINQTVIGSGTLAYTWIYGDNSPNGSAANPSHLYAVAGGYKVTLSVSANGCKSAITKNAYQFAKPKANFVNVSAPVCANTPITFENTSIISLGEQGSLWSYGNGNTSTFQDGYTTFAIPNTYRVLLTSVSEFGCTDTISKAVVIKPAPSPSFIVNKLCSGEPSKFLNTTVETIANPTYTWTISDNTTYNTKNITKSWANEGTYTVTLKANFTNGCTGTISKEEVVLKQPASDFTVKDICSGEIANYVNLTSGDKGNIKYLWDLGNGLSTDAMPKRLYTPAVTTTYTVVLAASYIDGCADTTIKTITVSQAPTCAFTIKNLGFLKYQFTPSNTSYVKYEWFFGDGGSDNVASPAYQYAYVSAFTVKMVATNAAGCQCETTNALSANTSIKSMAAGSGLNIYPNPNSGIFTITSGGSNGMKIEVYNLLGSKILSQVNADNTTTINLGDVAKGIYLVKVTVDGVTTTTKVTVTD